MERQLHVHTRQARRMARRHTQTRTLLTFVAGLILALLRHCGDVQLRHHLVEVGSPTGGYIAEGSALAVGGAMDHLGVLPGRGTAAGGQSGER